MVQYGVEGSSTFLECQARSPHAVIKWHLQRDNSDRRKEVSCHILYSSKTLLVIMPIVFVFTQNPQTTIKTFLQMNMKSFIWTDPDTTLDHFTAATAFQFSLGAEVYMQYDI